MPPFSDTWFRRLDTQLVLGFLGVSLVPALLVGALLTWGGLQLAERLALENVARTADAYAADLDLFVQRQRNHLSQLAQERPTGAELSATVRTTEGLEAVWDPNQGDTSDPKPADWAREACLELAQTPEQGVTHAGAGHAHEVVMRVSSAAGVLCGQLTFTLHQEMMTEQASSFLGGRAYIVDPSGTVVCHTFDDSRHHDPRGEQLSSEVAAAASSRADWAGRVAGDAGDVMAAYAPSSELEWGVWAEVPVSQALGPYWTGLWQSVLLAAAIALLAAGLAVLLARRLAAPVRAVAEAAVRVTAGELGAKVPVRGPTEVALLARKFNTMSQALARSHGELEARVVARTRELSAARAFSDRLLDTMHHQILVFDPDLRIVRANAAALDAHGQDIIGTSIDRSVLPTSDTVRAVLETASPIREERSEGPDSPIFEVETVPVHDDEGAAVGVLEVSRDVTELRRFQTRLAHQEKMAALGTLAAGLAHEIGNPLASMSSELEMLERIWDPDDARTALPILREQVGRMARLLRELVDLGKPPTDYRTQFDLAQLVEEVARLLRHDPRSRGTTIEVEPLADLDVHTQRDGLAQVLVNLGLNALDAVSGDANARVVLSMTRDADEVWIDVTDTGRGLAPEVASRVFDPFYTTKSPGQGTGLGLFVSAQVVRRLGGRLEYARTTPGSRFRVSLPHALPPELAGTEE